MQWKIARSGRLADALNGWAIRRGFPVLAWLAPRAPRWFLLANARWIIALVMFVHSRPKRAIARNLARVLRSPAESRAVRRAVRSMLRHLAFYWVDLFRFAQLPPERLRALVVGGGRRELEPIERLREAGRRVILLTGHLGNWELGSVLAGQAGLPISIVYVPDEFGEAERYRSFLRGRGDVEEIPIRPEERFASLPVLRAFDRGRVVAMQGDRDWNDRGESAPFLGAEARFPLGPFHLARMTGALLVPVFIAYTAELRFEIQVGAPIEVERTEDREGDARRALARWLQVLEAAVLRWPTQWYTFYDFWPPPAAAERRDAA
ncbi:MAG TPA: lysophospholipid acyltransferase family protein [Thermoanaerobaculia bacterium]|nr:lysophospholipid acyltransferase family protein [Thermoanaerobaculia bacterium]